MEAQVAGKLRQNLGLPEGKPFSRQRLKPEPAATLSIDRATTMRPSTADHGRKEAHRTAAPAVEQLPATIYAELRQIAQRFMRGEGASHTLQPTALVHEAFLRVAGKQGVAEASATHLRALFAQAMRRILVDHARRRHARKRGGERIRVALDERLLSAASEEDLLDL